jgi:HAE1 family hydrophobic/amphiphilic exporter-1
LVRLRGARKPENPAKKTKKLGIAAQMISKVFIRRPRLSFVIAILMTLVGLISIVSMPVSQYPNITPPQVQVSSTYTGASAEVVTETVVEPIENQVNGVEDMIYMSSTGGNDGSQNTTVTFYPGTSGDMNTVNTQNRVSLALPHLPDSVSRQGVTVRQKSTNMLLIISLFSPDNSYDPIFLSNYTLAYIQNELLRIRGVADVSILGEQDYSMRVWMNPDKMASLKISTSDVVSAINAQNVQVAAGQIGLPPTPAGQAKQFMIQVKGRLSKPKEFEEIVIRADSSGAQIKIKDIARVEMGAFSYQSYSQCDGKPGINLAVYQLVSGNGLQIADDAYKKMRELKKYFPPGIDYSINYDTTKFVRVSIRDIIKTLFIAVFLVIGVVYLFLQNWRSVLVPTLAIPVSLIGTFAVLMALGYSINLISLFGLILAIGIVVDDAIIVVENCHRIMETEHLSPPLAAEKTMSQVTNPIVATTLVLMAMFVPVCFIPGITGALYRQFAVTISCAVLISAINALTLSPALAAVLLKPGHGQPFLPFRLFNKFFDWVTLGFAAGSEMFARKAFLCVFFLAACLLGSQWLYDKIPSGFIPDEDMGAFFVNVQLPDAASVERTQAAVSKALDVISRMDGVAHTKSVIGYNMIDQVSAPNNALIVVILKDWDERKNPMLFQRAILRKTQLALSKIPAAAYFCFPRPAIPDIGNTGGINFVLEDIHGVKPKVLEQVLNSFLAEARKQPEIGTVFSTYSANVPQLYLEIDREKALKLGVNLSDVFNSLQAYLGAYYVNDFNKYGQVYQVMIQVEGRFRNDPLDIRGLYVKNSSGNMVPMGTFLTMKTILGPQTVLRYNMYQAARVTGAPAQGRSSGEAMAALEKAAAAALPDGFKYDWTDMSYQERQAAGKAGIIFGISLLFIYFFLVGQYESWMIPIAIMLSVPVALLGALTFLYILRVENNIYTQIGFVLLFGITCKTEILIVEFAKNMREQGYGIVESAIRARKVRFRAVVMTGTAFILGVFPLVIAVGAGAASQRSLGTAIFGGMLVGEVLGTLMTPMFYVAIQWLREKVGGWKPPVSAPPAEDGAAPVHS